MSAVSIMQFSSTLQHALGEERHFALVENAIPGRKRLTVVITRPLHSSISEELDLANNDKNAHCG